MNKPQPVGTIHLQPVHLRRPTAARTTGPLFNGGTLQWVTAQAAHYATVEGDEAMRFAIGLAVLDHSRYASA
ncbi:hypothetical protein SBC1_14480 [Caballeronia sp. SBC1]|uniref:hypothetical protein n=1 Tax=unclassified Caballeronia TaxID=2646786 RepID=UPI0013E1E779|nr:MULTISPECIES: hypothetical protein [unclassified Caballeronia]QIE23561.1 hypothetical protein SBC2_15870 [Caballeronia sp. SBC2]QIN61456.1 hypothetical protein SBC1_14480 [Caballeronia sp. SBC1]